MACLALSVLLRDAEDVRALVVLEHVDRRERVQHVFHRDARVLAHIVDAQLLQGRFDCVFQQRECQARAERFTATKGTYVAAS